MSDVGQKVLRTVTLERRREEQGLKVNFGSNHSNAEKEGGGAAAFKAVTRVEVTVCMLRLR